MPVSWVIDLRGHLDRADLWVVCGQRSASMRSGVSATTGTSCSAKVTRAIAGVAARVELWRDVDSQGWRLDIELPADPDDSDVQDLLAALRAEVESAGVQIDFDRPSPLAIWMHGVVTGGRVRYEQARDELGLA